MAFRKVDKPGPFGTRWRLANRATLIEYGMPAVVTESDRRWTYALLHGDDPESGWDVSWLSDEQGRHLVALVKPQLESPAGVDLVRRIERRLSAGEKPGPDRRGGG